MPLDYRPGRGLLPFVFGLHFLNGLGGPALLGTVRIAFIASQNRVNPSGPSIISGERLAICFMMAQRSPCRLIPQNCQSIGLGIA